MSYIKISNKTDNVNRLFLEKFGLSTKRDNPATIGQFGSGAKLAPIAALRNGWEWVNVGCDDLGPYRMDYVIATELGIECVFFKYDDGTMKPSSFTKDAGVLSWDEDFQIFREAFANALDEYIESGTEYRIEIVDEITYDEGWFSVYITAAPAMLDIVNNFDRYFSINRTPLWSSPNGAYKIFEPLDEGGRIYFKGVRICDTFVNSEKPGIFDYEYSVNLNEERRLKDNGSAYYGFAQLLQNLPDDEVGRYIAEKIIESDDGEFGEHYCYNYPYFSSYDENPFRSYFKNRHGEACIYMADDWEPRFSGLLKLHGTSGVKIKTNFVYGILNGAKLIKNIREVLGDSVEYNFVEIGVRATNKLNEAIDIVAEYDDRIKLYPVRIFDPIEGQESVLGVAPLSISEIYINKNILDNQKVLIGTLVHELDHHVTFITDGVEFRNPADNRIADLILENKRLNDLYLSNVIKEMV